MLVKYILHVLFFICPISIFSQINFDTQSYPSCLNDAKVDNKPFVVYFYADWCLPCQIMEETTFQSSEVATALNEHMTPYKVEYDSEMSKSWQEDYAVSCLPTMIFFDSNGNVTERVECGLTSNCLLAMVEEQTDYSSYASNQINNSNSDSNSNYATISSDGNLNSSTSINSNSTANSGIKNEGNVVTAASNLDIENNGSIGELESGTGNAIAHVGSDSEFTSSEFTSKGANSNDVLNKNTSEIHNSLDNEQITYSENNYITQTNVSNPENTYTPGTGIYVDGVRVNSSNHSNNNLNIINSSNASFESSSVNLNERYDGNSTSDNSNNNTLRGKEGYYGNESNKGSIVKSSNTYHSTNTSNTNLQDKINSLNSTIEIFEERLKSADTSNSDCSNLMNTVASLKSEIIHLSNSLARIDSNPNESLSKRIHAGKVVFFNAENYEVQLGLFRSERNAEKLSLKVDIDLDEPLSYIIKENVKGEVMYRVVYGAYDHRAEAVKAYKKINKAGYKAFVKSI